MALKHVHVSLIDDDPMLIRSLERRLAAKHDDEYEFIIKGYITQDGFFSELNPNISNHIVLVDMRLGSENAEGPLLVQELKKRAPNSIVVALTHDSTFARAMHFEADDYLLKSSELDTIRARLIQSLERRSHTENLARQMAHPNLYAGQTLRDIHQELIMVLQQPAIRVISLYGPSGAGKEVVVNLLEHLADQKQIIRVNCGSCSTDHILDLFFGHTKGAFTSANVARTGLFEEADGGWVFLDEISNLSLEAQQALLRVIENGEVQRIGENRPKKISVRLIVASNVYLEEEVKSKRFRNDLWQRLQEKVIHLPGLNDRRNEIVEIAECIAQNLEGGPFELSASVKTILNELDWSNGNIRELRNVLRASTSSNFNSKLITRLDRRTLAMPRFQACPATTSCQESSLPPLSNADTPWCQASHEGLTLQMQANGGNKTWNLQHWSNLLLLALAQNLAETENEGTQKAIAMKLEISTPTLRTSLVELGKQGYQMSEKLKQMFLKSNSIC